MDKDKIEKTKDNLRLSKMDERTRKELFNRFVDGGGEVVKQRSKRSTAIDRERQSQYRNQIDRHSRRKASDSIKQNGTGKRAAIQKKNKAEKTKPFEMYFENLKIRLHLKFLKVTWLNGYYFNIRYLERFNNDYKTALIEIQMVFLDVFKKNLQNGNRITRKLDKSKPLYYELLEMISNVYDNHSAAEIVDHYVNFPDVPKKVAELKKPLMEIYRRLYVLKLYENTIYNTFLTVIDFQEKLENGKSSSYSINRKRIKKDLFIVFHKLYPRLHWLFCFYEQRFFEMNDPLIETVLSIVRTEKPGNRVYVLKKKKEAEAEAEVQTSVVSENDEVEKSEKTEAVKEGLELMYDLDFDRLRSEYDRSGLFEMAEQGDPVLVTYLLFSEFDKEYSFVLTSNKIKYSVDFGDRGKTDYKAIFQNLYNEMRKCSKSLKDYAETYKMYESVRAEKNVGKSLYIEYTKRLDTLKKKKESAGNQARHRVADYMKKVCEEVEPLIRDINGDQRFIVNPQEILDFNSDIEGHRKLNGKKIYEAVHTLFNFASAMVSRLGYDGDLSGQGEVPVVMQDKDSGNDEETGLEPDRDEKEDSGKSILDELDDLL